jgi:hypothetical protein
MISSHHPELAAVVFKDFLHFSLSGPIPPRENWNKAIPAFILFEEKIQGY